jgi:hypothetical protein
MLASDAVNRTIRKPLVQALARAINRGEWVLNGETVKIGPDGELLDG